jgi:myo-inositol-1(or 4)-monophosphatase
MAASRAPARRRASIVKPSGVQAELDLARHAAREAGKILRGHWHRGGYTIGSKGHDNPVTEADLEADRALKRMLHDPYPQYGWLSEETVDDESRLKRRRVWIVDPLDGTKEFIKGIPEFVVAIALVEDGEPIMGVTYNPIRREMYWGARDIGCYLNTRRVRVSRKTTLANATVLASRSETARGEWASIGGGLKVRAMGSVAYKLAMVAAGRADATFTRSPKNEWDVASGAALVAAAGGTVTDINGKPVRFNRRNPLLPGFIADNSSLHRALVKIASDRAARK